MGKYANLEKDVFSVFSASNWVAENIKTYPNNFLAINAGNEYIRVLVIPNSNGINLRSVSGVLIIDIFISAGSGPNKASLIADKLDLYLVGKSKTTGLNNITQFKNSTLSHVGVDKDNPSLYRSTYTIPFNYFGV